MPARDCFATLAMTTLSLRGPAGLTRGDEAISLRHGGAEMARLTGKVALITGAAGGQGVAEAELFVREEGAVVLTDTDTAAGEALAQRLSRQGGNALFLAPGRRRRGIVEGVGGGGADAFWQAAHPCQQCRYDRPPEHRRYDRRGVEPDLGGQSDRRDARHETLRAGDPRQRRRLDHQHLIRRRTDG